MTPEAFHAILAELTLENPMAVRPFLRILETRFTTDVPTLSVTKEDRPALLVNLEFVARHCRTDAQVKALLLHEFLHVVLRHTERRGPSTDAEHLAMDAVINAIIHRQAGPEYSSMMSEYYAGEQGIRRILRPPNAEEDRAWSDARARSQRTAEGEQFFHAWVCLYAGYVVIDDIRELLEQMTSEAKRRYDHDRRIVAQKLKPNVRRALGIPDSGPVPPPDLRERLLGGHDDGEQAANGLLAGALEDALRSMPGEGRWRDAIGCGSAAAAAEVAAAEDQLRRWKRKALGILKRHVVPDARARATERAEAEPVLPVLSARDRRAFLRATWSPFLPEASWAGSMPKKRGSAQVYLDVSGSMADEMAHLVALLGSLRRWIRMPFFAFSTYVVPARIEKGVLETTSSGGTSIGCVLRHIAETRPEKAVIVTDGFVESIPQNWPAMIAGTKIHAIVSRDGSTSAFDRVRIPATQLDALP